MENRRLVRIVKNTLSYFKNVDFGEVRYMNYSSVEKKGELVGNDIVGIYGQNGSGKTALVEALDILKHILSGNEIPYDVYGGLISQHNKTKLVTEFFIEENGNQPKHKVEYEVKLGVDDREKKIKLICEKLTYWERGATWKGERDFEFANPYYNVSSILDDINVELVSSNEKQLEEFKISKSLKNLAIYCAQKNISIFFNELLFDKNFDKNYVCDGEERFSDIIYSLINFGKLYFQVVKVNQLADINRNVILPVNIHSENDDFVMQGCLPLVMSGRGKITENLYKDLKNAIDAINIGLKAIIPNLNIELRKVSEERDEKENNYIVVEMYSVRGDKEFLTKYESEGIKRIISLLHYLIALYNQPEICLVVDELDSGIFEYLLGEILGVLNEEAKGQLIFTSHNLRAFEKLNIKSIICTTVNSNNRYIRLKGKEKNHNPRDFYIRTITVGGQMEELYDEADLQSIGYAFRKAYHPERKVSIKLSDSFKKKLLEEP